MTRTEKLALILFAFVLWATTFAAFAGMSMSPGTPVHTHSDANSGGGTLALSGALTSTNACAAGYTRITPNYCALTTPGVGTSLTRDVCTAVTSPSANAKAFYLRLFNRASTANSVAARFTTINGFTDSGCTTPANALVSSVATSYEEVAKVAATTLMETQIYVIAPTVTLWLKMADDAGNQGFGSYEIDGYFD